MIIQFDWDPRKARLNFRSHGVSFRQAASIFLDPNHLSIFDDEHSDIEERWITIGLDKSGVLRAVVHTHEESSPAKMMIRLISARKATRSEEQQYQEVNRK